MTYEEEGSTVIKTPVDFDVEREKRGYSLIKKDQIKCGNCQRPLIDLIKIKEDKEIETAIRAYCPFCNDCSFWYKISGKICIQAVEGLSILDMPMDIRNGIRFTNIKVVKNEQK